jgi:xylose isomerase
MYEVLKAGGFSNGGLNFDAKARRASNTVEDIIYSYIAGMDAFALGLRKAAAIIQDGRIDKFIKEKYKSYKITSIGKKIESNKTSLLDLYNYSKNIPIDTINIPSGRQEYLEEILNDILFKQ